MPGELIITCGAQCSGKTFWAKEYCETHRRSVRVERDQIRQLFGKPFGTDEKFITKERDRMIAEFLMRDCIVISSDVNLSHKTRAQLERIAAAHNAQVYYKLFTDVPLEECLERNSARPPETFIPPQAIRELYTNCIDNSSYLKNIPYERIIN